jgi:hypothetical protein
MKHDHQTDELLNAFIDGELNDRHRTEVARLISHDPQVAARLQELERCKILLESLPRAEAPAWMLEKIRAPIPSRPKIENLTGARHLLARKVLATAAVIALVGVLATVVYDIVIPGSPEGSGPDSYAAAPSPDVPQFYGRVELITASLPPVDSVIRRAIDYYGLSPAVPAEQLGDTTSYTVSCDRGTLSLLLADLRDVWNELDSATLYVETATPAEKLAIEAVTTEQIVAIVGENTAEARRQVARDLALMNKMDQLIPGREVLAAAEPRRTTLAAPKPTLTSRDTTVSKRAGESESDRNIHLTIVIAQRQ